MTDAFLLLVLFLFVGYVAGKAYHGKEFTFGLYLQHLGVVFLGLIAAFVVAYIFGGAR